MTNTRLLNLVLYVVLSISLGWLLWVGQGILIPILIAVISVYVLTETTRQLKRLPFFRIFPIGVLRVLILLGFVVAFSAMATVFSGTLRELVTAAPTYQANLQNALNAIADTFGAEAKPTINELLAATLGQIKLQSLLSMLLGGVTSFGATFFLIFVYAAFLMAERGQFDEKLARALTKPGQVNQIKNLVSEINSRIGDYLAAKTLVNVVLGVVSYLVLLVIGVDFAVFWAILIALLNYIPYVGSLAGVLFPVALSLAQFGSVSTSALLTTLLVSAQIYVGYVFEPRVIGRRVNLSPFVVMVALSVWSALWGLPGAILAIPLTAMIVIVLEQFAETRFLAVLLDGGVTDGPMLETVKSNVGQS